MARPGDCAIVAGVELDVRPEPPEEVRAALEAALLVDGEQPPSAWWRAGVDEAVDGGE